MSTTHASQRHPAVALGVIVTVQMMVVLDATVVNIALPSIQSGLHFSTAGLSWVINAYTLAFGGLLLLGGRAGDVFGRRQMFMAGIALFTVASLAGGLATSASWLVIARAVQGIGAAAAAPSALALLATNFAEGPERNRALGVFAGVSSGGASVGLILGGALTGFSWRWVLFINVPVGIVVLFLAPRFLQNSERNRGRIDYTGAATSVVGMAALVYGLIRSGSAGWGDATALISLGAGIVIMAAFVYFETQAETPIVPLRLFKNRTRAGAYALMLLLPSAMFGLFFYLTQYLQEAYGYSALRTGVAFLPMTLLIFTASRFSPRMLPVFGARRLLIVGLTLTTAGMFWLTTLTQQNAYVSHVLGPLMLIGLGIGLSFMPITTTILAGVARQDSGAASSLLQAMQQVGGTLGLAALVTVFGVATHHAHAPVGAEHLALPLRSHGVRAGFGAAGILAAIGIAVAVLVLRPQKPSDMDIEAADLTAESIIEMV
jgi:EmrB/QacA subfamily drug resistance transporter